MPQTSQTADFEIDLPDDWIERSMIVWSAPSMPGRPVAPNVVIAYDKPRTGENLGGYVNRQLAELSAKAQKFQLDLHRPVKLAGRPAVETIFRWESGGSVLKQRQLFSLLSGERVVCIAGLAAGEDFAAVEPAFLAILNSLRWRGAPGLSAPDRIT
jgi:hypothetical protein